MEKRKLKYCDLVFENCAVARLKPSMFKYLCVEKIYENCWINCFQYEKGEVHDMIFCEYLEISINKKGMELYLPIEKKTLHKRLENWSDITHIHLFFNDKTDKYISVPWGGKYCENEKQQTTIKEDSINIVISEKPKCKNK